MPTIHDEVEHYLVTGEHDHFFAAWPGKNVFECAQLGRSDLQKALLAEVTARTKHAVVPEPLNRIDVVPYTRSKVEPMVCGLFPATERPPVLDMLARSVVFLTPAAIEPVLNRQPFLATAWHLANLYLASCDAPMLSADARLILGLSDATTCYVSTEYFEPTNRFDDFLVHEAAHVFHNCKRATVGLPETRRREWLLDIAFSKRELFAYACETYSRIVELGDTLAARRELVAEVEAGPFPPEEKVDGDEYVNVLREAVAARNGWKRILAKCATTSMGRSNSAAAASSA